MNLWQKISDLGIPEDVDLHHKKQMQMTNRMILIGIIITIPYYPIFLGSDTTIPLIQVNILTVLLATLYLFTSKGNHKLAAILLCLIVMTHLVCVSIFIEGGTGKFYLIPVSILGFTVLRDIRTSVILFIVAVIAFFSCHYLPEFFEPLVPENPDTARITFNINMVLIFFGTMYFILQLKNINKKYETDIVAQKDLIESQHSQLKETHKNIQDSIKYAQRIQTALMPPLTDVKKHLPDNFILYLPKDIVAGDFYWVEEDDNAIYFAAADCTGHGVPGAMVSVICNNALNRSIHEYHIKNTNDILDKSREIIIKEFQKSEEQVRDGMDIALCKLVGNKLQFSGAHNPAWIVRNKELIELKADRQPIGQHATAVPHTKEEFDLQKGDMIYVFTDGYADQFGGPEGKKFKQKNLMDLLKMISVEAVEEQKQILEDTHLNWKGNLEQIDDICIIGVRI